MINEKQWWHNSLREIEFFKSTLSDVIAKVIEQVTQLLNAEIAGVMLYDEETDELVLQKPAFGIKDEEIISTYRVPLSGEGNAVKVFLTGEPYISNDSPRDSRLLHRYVTLFGAQNTITVPLEVDNRRIGVIHVNNKRNGGFTSEDLELLTLLASHLAVLIENIALYEREKKQAEKLSKINAEMQIHQYKLKKLQHIHNKLIHKVLDEEGLESIVRILVDVVKAPVFIEDRHLNILCSSESIIDNQYSLRHLVQQNQNLEKKLVKGQILKITPYFYQGNECIRIIAPIGGANNIMGYLSVIANAHQIDDELETLAIEQGALVIALEMMKDKIKAEVEERYHSELLDDLLAGAYENKDIVLQRAESFGYDLEKPNRVVVVNNNEEQGKRKTTDHLPTTWNRHFQDAVISNAFYLLPKCLAVRKRNSIVFIVPSDELLNTQALTQKLKELRDSVSKHFPGINIKIGVGKRCQILDDYQESYKQAVKASSIAGIIDAGERVIFYEKLGIYSLLLEINDDNILKKFLDEKIGPLLHYDTNKNLSLTNTLDKYLESKGSLKETANSLYIHEATLKYRLRRIQEILQIDLKDTKNLLELQLALQINRLLND